MAIVANETATIRVSRKTRDLLAEQARRSGVSLSAMLHEVARSAARQAALASEREATRTDAVSTDVAGEERDWDRAVGDGLG